MPVSNTLPNGVVESSNSDPASLGGFAYASSVRQTYKVADQAALNLLADMETGDLAFRQDNLAYYYYTGSSWRVWYTTLSVNFTPVWTGLTTGNGTLNYARYNVNGSQTTAEISFTLGSTSSVSNSGVFVAYPTGTTYAIMDEFQRLGETWFFRNVTNSVGYTGVVGHRLNGQVSVELQRSDQGITPPAIYHSGISSTLPFTWGTGAKMVIRWTWLS